MAEWIYRATAAQADWGATDESLTHYNFLCRKAYARGNRKTGIFQLVANVRHVLPDDVIHVAFSSEQHGETILEGIGSFRVLDSGHPDQEGPIDDATHGHLSLFRVCEHSPLGQMLAVTTYTRDPRLGAFTGWHVCEVEPRDIAFTQAMFPGNGATSTGSTRCQSTRLKKRRRADLLRRRSHRLRLPRAFLP